MPQTSLDRKSRMRSRVYSLVQVMQTGRPFVSVIAGAQSVVAISSHKRLSIQAILAGVVMSLVTMFGFVINDIFDYEKDVAAGVQRPIAMGEISKREALWYSVFLVLVAWSLAVVLGPGRWVVAFAILALLLYTPFARRVPLLKGVYVAVLCALPLFYSSTVSRTPPSWQMYAVLVVWIFGRETLMDAHEMEGDRQAGMTTIAVALGQPRARHLGVTLMLATPFWMIGAAQTAIGRSFAMLTMLSFLCILLWPRIQEDRRIVLSRFSVLAAALAVASG